MQGIETHAGKHRECRYMGVGTVPLVQKGHPCRGIKFDTLRLAKADAKVKAVWPSH